MNTDNQCNKLALNIKSEWVDNPPHTHTHQTNRWLGDNIEAERKGDIPYANSKVLLSD